VAAPTAVGFRTTVTTDGAAPHRGGAVASSRHPYDGRSTARCRGSTARRHGWRARWSLAGAVVVGGLVAVGVGGRRWLARRRRPVRWPPVGGRPAFCSRWA